MQAIRLHTPVSWCVQFMAQYRRDQANHFGLVLLCFIHQMTVEAYLLTEVVHLHLRSRPPLERISIKKVKNDAKMAQEVLNETLDLPKPIRYPH